MQARSSRGIPAQLMPFRSCLEASKKFDKQKWLSGIPKTVQPFNSLRSASFQNIRVEKVRGKEAIDIGMVDEQFATPIVESQHARVESSPK